MEKINDTRFYGTTPDIRNDETVAEIFNMKFEDLGGGVIRFPAAITVDKDMLLPYIDNNSKTAHEQRWTWAKDEEGNDYAINEDGNKFSPEQVKMVPVRLLEVVNANTEPEMIEVFRYWEDSIYKCLLKYIDIFPMVLGTIWWRTKGHVMRYDEGAFLGIHNDNDSNYRATNGERFVPRGQIQMRQVAAVMLYLNDCVDEESELDGQNYTGGELVFPYLGIKNTPKTGDIVIFPANFMATHGVEPVKKGVRYGYLEFFSQGSSHDEIGINVSEPQDCDGWCRPHFIDNLYDDYNHYCKKTEFMGNGDSAKDANGMFKANPVYQNRTLEGENGLKKAYSHSRVVYDNEQRGKERSILY